MSDNLSDERKIKRNKEKEESDEEKIIAFLTKKILGNKITEDTKLSKILLLIENNLEVSLTRKEIKDVVRKFVKEYMDKLIKQKEEEKEEIKQDDKENRRLALEKYKELYKDIGEKKKASKIKITECKGYNIVNLLSKLFRYCLTSNTNIDDVNKKDFINWLFSFEDYKDCDKDELLKNYDFIEEILLNTLSGEEVDDRFIEALELLFKYIIYETDERYSTNLSTFEKFVGFISPLLTEPLSSDMEQLEYIYKKLSSMLFYFFILNDVIDLLMDDASFMTGDFNDAAEYIYDNLKDRTKYSRIVESETASRALKNEINKIVSFFQSDDLDVISNIKGYNILQYLIDIYDISIDDLTQYLVVIFPNQSEDNLNTFLDMFVNKDKIISKCSIDEITIGAQLMNIAIKNNIQIVYATLESLLNRLKEEFIKDSCTNEEILELMKKPLEIMSVDTYKDYTSNLDSVHKMIIRSNDLYSTFEKIDSADYLLRVLELLFSKLSNDDLRLATRNIISVLPQFENIIMYDYNTDALYKTNKFIQLLQPILYHKVKEYSIEEKDNYHIFSKQTGLNISKFVLPYDILINFVSFSKNFPDYLNVLNFDKSISVCEVERVSDFEPISSFNFEKGEKTQLSFLLLLLLLSCYEKGLFITFSSLDKTIFVKRGKTKKHTFTICGNNYTIESELDIRVFPYYWGSCVYPLVCNYTFMDRTNFKKYIGVSLKNDEDFFMVFLGQLDKIKDQLNVSVNECPYQDVDNFSQEIVGKFSPVYNEISFLRNIIDDRTVSAMFSYFCIRNMSFDFYKNLITIVLLSKVNIPKNIYHNLSKSLYYRLNDILADNNLEYIDKNVELLLSPVLNYSIKNREVLATLQDSILKFRKSYRTVSKSYLPPPCFCQVMFVKDTPDITQLLTKIMSNNLNSVAKRNLPTFLKKELSTYSNDLVFYSNLRKYVKDNYESLDRYKVDTIRAKARWRDVSSILESIKVRKILDYGGSNGAILSYIADMLKLNKNDAVSIDIETWQGNIIERNYKNITYKTIKPKDKLSFEDDRLDVITCFQVLHHISSGQLYEMIEDFYRCLKKGGILIIREHDCNSVDTRFLIDIEHNMLESVVDVKNKMNGIQLCEYKDGYNYQSIDEWVSLITGVGFEVIENKGKSYEVSGPTRYTFRYFRKN